MSVKVFKAYNLEKFERDNYYMNRVSEEIVEEALKKMGK